MWMNAKITVVKTMQHAMMELLHTAVNVLMDGLEFTVNQVSSNIKKADFPCQFISLLECRSFSPSAYGSGSLVYSFILLSGCQ